MAAYSKKDQDAKPAAPAATPPAAVPTPGTGKAATTTPGAATGAYGAAAPAAAQPAAAPSPHTGSAPAVAAGAATAGYASASPTATSTSEAPCGSLPAGQAATDALATPVAPAPPRAKAELRLCARLVDTSSDSAQGEPQPLAGVCFRVYADPAATGKPICELRSTDLPFCRVPELDPGCYCAVATAPPPAGCGQAAVPVDYTRMTCIVHLASGDAPEVPFDFRRSRSQVAGQVCDRGDGCGLAGVAMLLLADQGAPQMACTDRQGQFLFQDVAPGTYGLRFASDKTVRDGKTWVQPEGAPKERQVHVAGHLVRVEPLFLQHDRHVIVAKVTDYDDRPIPHAEVTIQSHNRQVYGTATADADGRLRYEVDAAGLYYLVVNLGADGMPSIAYPVEVHSDSKTLHAKAGRPGVGGGGGHLLPPAGGQDAVFDVPYPLLTESAMFPGGGGGGTAAGGGAPNTGALGTSVAATLRGVLGWRPRGGDAKGFLSALNQAFKLTDVAGHRDFKWTQPTFAVQPDMGGLTGAQASIYTRAKAAIDQSLPLLEGLTPLRPDADAVDCEAIRSVVRSELIELVSELGQEGGPRVQRVSSLFNLLLGSVPLGAVAHSHNPENVGGQLRRVRAEFGMDRSRITTIDEEQNLTNFFILVDYVISLKQSWDSQRQFFDRRSGAEPFLGTQLVLVSRALMLLTETVQELYFVMDSVFLGAADRQVVELAYPQEPLTIAELLTWVETVASEEGPRLIQEGGKSGVIALKTTIAKLTELTSGALIPPQNPERLPAGYRTARVQRSMQELREHLRETGALIHSFHQTDPEPI
jgi:hypothetical protein